MSLSKFSFYSPGCKNPFRCHVTSFNQGDHSGVHREVDAAYLWEPQATCWLRCGSKYEQSVSEVCLWAPAASREKMHRCTEQVHNFFQHSLLCGGNIGSRFGGHVTLAQWPDSAWSWALMRLTTSGWEDPSATSFAVCPFWSKHSQGSKGGVIVEVPALNVLILMVAVLC